MGLQPAATFFTPVHRLRNARRVVPYLGQLTLGVNGAGEDGSGGGPITGDFISLVGNVLD